MKECCKMGLTPAEFWELTPKEINLFLSGRQEAMRFWVEQGWDYARHIMTTAIIPYSQTAVKPSDIFKLPRDSTKSVKQLSKWEKQQLGKWSKEQDRIMIKP